MWGRRLKLVVAVTAILWQTWQWACDNSRASEGLGSQSSEFGFASDKTDEIQTLRALISFNLGAEGERAEFLPVMNDEPGRIIGTSCLLVDNMCTVVEDLAADSLALPVPDSLPKRAAEHTSVLEPRNFAERMHETGTKSAEGAGMAGKWLQTPAAQLPRTSMLPDLVVEGYNIDEQAMQTATSFDTVLAKRTAPALATESTGTTSKMDTLAKGTLAVEVYGINMAMDELVNNSGAIAKARTKASYRVADELRGFGDGAPQVAGYKPQTNGVLSILETLLDKFKAQLHNLEIDVSDWAHYFILELSFPTDTIEKSNTDRSERISTKASLAEEFAEVKSVAVKSVHFQAEIFDAMSMDVVLVAQGRISDKLAKARSVLDSNLTCRDFQTVLISEGLLDGILCSDFILPSRGIRVGACLTHLNSEDVSNDPGTLLNCWWYCACLYVDGLACLLQGLFCMFVTVARCLHA